MNISAPFIRRPVATTLLTAGVALAGILAFQLLSLAPLPQANAPCPLAIAPVQSVWPAAALAAHDDAPSASTAASAIASFRIPARDGREAAHDPPPWLDASSEATTIWRRDLFHTKL